MTHASAVAAELPAEAFEWGFGESIVAMEGPSSAPKASRTGGRLNGTPSRERSKVPIVVVQPVPSVDEHKEGSTRKDPEPGATKPAGEAPKPAADPARPNKIILHIAVTDSGSGIAPSALPHLFQPYSQEKLSIMRTHGGTGLGQSKRERRVGICCAWHEVLVAVPAPLFSNPRSPVLPCVLFLSRVVQAWPS